MDQKGPVFALPEGGQCVSEICGDTIKERGCRDESEGEFGINGCCGVEWDVVWGEVSEVGADEFSVFECGIGCEGSRDGRGDDRFGIGVERIIFQSSGDGGDGGEL